MPVKIAPQPKILTMSLSELKAARYNPRKISRRAMNGLEASINRFGLVQPIVYNKRTHHVVGGHQRLRVLMAKGITQAQVVLVDLPESEEKALNLTLNKPGVAGEFTVDLNEVLDGLEEQMGKAFEDLNLDRLQYSTSQADPDALDQVPEPPKKPVTKPGDMWTLGEHRLLCGDATSKKDWSRLMAGEVADLIFTDPPYGVSYQDQNHKYDVIEGDDKRRDELAVKLLAPSFQRMAETGEKAHRGG